MQPFRVGSRPYIAVTGTIGSGASTLAARLARAEGWIPLLEADAGTNPFFVRMYAEPGRWGFHSQVQFLVGSARRHRELGVMVVTGQTVPVVEDRTPFEHRAVYLRVQRELGLLPDDELTLLTDLALVVERGFRHPDVLVYRPTPRRVADERILRRARPGEEHMAAEWLAAVDAAFDDMVSGWTAGPVVMVDEGLDVEDAVGVAALADRVRATLTPSARPGS